MVTEKRKEIRLTPDELLAANFAALGISGAAFQAPASSRERIFAAYVDLIRKKGRSITAIEVSDATGICSSRVSLVARQLFKEGRMHRLTDRSTGKIVYVPIVKQDA